MNSWDASILFLQGTPENKARARRELEQFIGPQRFEQVIGALCKFVRLHIRGRSALC